MSELAARHAATAATFTEVATAVSDWDAPTPVSEWVARDVVGHLTSWLPGLLGAGGVVWPAGPSASADPVAAWTYQCRQVQDLLEDPQRAQTPITFPGGSQPAAEVIADFYEPDVFMHAWDLARSADLDFHLDPERCAEAYAGMSAMSEMIRASGQFGELVEVGPDATAEDRLIGFIGRDPYWTPPRPQQG